MDCCNTSFLSYFSITMSLNVFMFIIEFMRFKFTTGPVFFFLLFFAFCEHKTYLSIDRAISLFACLSVYLSSSLALFLFIFLSIFLNVYPFAVCQFLYLIDRYRSAGGNERKKMHVSCEEHTY